MILASILAICALSSMLTSPSVGQVPAAILDIHFTGHALGFWGRYAVSNGRTKSAGWTNSQSGNASYSIEGIFAGPKTRVKGIFYAPGCALQTLDINIKEARLYEYSFPCEPVAQTEIQGVAERLEPLLRGHNLKIEAKYVALWAPDFFGYDDGTTTEIPLGTLATVDQQDHFRLAIPNFTKDKLASSRDHAAEIRIWARDADNPRILAKLRLLSGNPKIQPTRFGGIPVDSLGSGLLEFVTCYGDPPAVRDEFGFNVRGAVVKHDCVR